MPGRRAALALPALLLGGRAAAVPAGYAFAMLRGRARVGTHRVTFTEAGGVLTAESAVDIVVRLAGFTVFRLSHRTQEVVGGGRLRGFASRLDRDGRVTEASVRVEGVALAVSGPDGPGRLPAEALPLAWWDAARLGGTRPLFDSDNGKPLRLQWTRAAAPGGGVRWRCTGENESEATYAADGTWLAFATRGDDGSTVTYEPA